tara:strand:+ start:104560 stop:105510 length:951 start_codon:yes stop_codon:yes gene_type:complete
MIGAHAQQTGSFQKSISFNEPDYAFTRTLYYFVPSTYDSSKNYPLVIGFRGGPHTNAGQFRDQLAFFSDSINAIVVCPENADHFNNQEGLVKQLFRYAMDTILSEYSIDTNRVYLTGLSYGGRHAVIVAMDTDNGPIPNLRGVIPFATGRNGELQPNYNAISQFAPACICIGGNDNQVFKDVATTLHTDIQTNNGISMLNEIPGIGHTVAFPTYPLEMMKCMNFIESNYLPNSVFENTESSFKWEVYPNPADSFITLKVSEMVPINQIYVVDTVGRILLTVSPNTRRVDISKFNKGLVYMVLTTSEGLFSKPITIQ